MSTTGATKRLPIEMTLTIHAPVEAVWEALCTADGLASWFPLEARVKPGAGGSVFTSWRNEYQFEMPIRVWEPNKRVSWQWGVHEHDQPEPSVVDFHLDSKGSDTVLRMVHHGFSAAAEWDAMYDGTVRGWDFELNSLKTYLDHHRGEKRHVAHVRSRLDGVSGKEAFERLLAPGALVERGTLAGLTTGDRFDITMRDGGVVGGGMRLTGEVRAQRSDMYLCLRIDNLDHAIMRIDIESCDPAKGPTLWLWLSAWGDDEGATERLNRAWLALLRERLGNAYPIGARIE